VRLRARTVGHRFPYEDGDTFVRAVDYIDDAAGSPNQAIAILEANAMGLFGIRD
jgi:6-methylsalicylate decarboxylase